MESPLLSISVITYNHEDYVKQAIDGILSQKVNFTYEVIIGDDCSTDRTRELLLDYQEKYPSIIKLILREEKGEGIPGKLNFISTIKAAKGKYIALLDGDDFWIDVNKIQTQVDFLEHNPEYSICFHKAKIVYEGGISRSYPDVNKDTKETTTISDLIKGNYIHASTCVFRKNFNSYPDWFMKVFTGDWVTHLLNAEHGKIFFIDQEMAAYRVHNRGLISARKLIDNDVNMMEMYKDLYLYFKSRNNEAYNFFKNLHYHQKAYFFGIENVRQNSIINRMTTLFECGWMTRKPKLILAAFMVPFLPGQRLGKVWSIASQKKKKLSQA